MTQSHQQRIAKQALTEQKEQANMMLQLICEKVIELEKIIKANEILLNRYNDLPEAEITN